jgi:hypothetical protein
MVVEVGMFPKVTGGKVIRIEELDEVYSSFIYNLTTQAVNKYIVGISTINSVSLPIPQFTTFAAKFRF